MCGETGVARIFLFYGSCCFDSFDFMAPLIMCVLFLHLWHFANIPFLYHWNHNCLQQIVIHQTVSPHVLLLCPQGKPQRKLHQANKAMLNDHEWGNLFIKKGRREGRGRKKNYAYKLMQPQDTTGSNLCADTLNRLYGSVYSIHEKKNVLWSVTTPCTCVILKIQGINKSYLSINNILFPFLVYL